MHTNFIPVTRTTTTTTASTQTVHTTTEEAEVTAVTDTEFSFQKRVLFTALRAPVIIPVTGIGLLSCSAERVGHADFLAEQ